MPGITTFTGSNLIREAREFVDRVGLPIELDTDGIWCMLPQGFPDNFKINLKNGKNSLSTCNKQPGIRASKIVASIIILGLKTIA